MSPRISEVHAYIHIAMELNSKKGWEKKQIFTQQECLGIKPLAEALGQAHPENIVRVRENVFYAIEAKNEKKKLDIALKEARDDYAFPVNTKNVVKIPIVTGIAGNQDEGFIAKSQFLRDGKWETITENDIEVTGLLSRAQVEQILTKNDPHIRDVEVSETEFLKTAEEINGLLHEGGIHKDYRARVMAAILLALVEGTELNLEETPKILIQSINSRVQVILDKHNKSNFGRFISIELPASEDNHLRFKKAIVQTVQELLNLNIRSAMKSGKDMLGTFYEVFLKYGNGAKEIGIVLTPRHITKFAAEALDIQPNDLVLDPTCGTGGFLVAALDKVKRSATANELEKFKKYGVFGIEEQDFVVSLALVNMIFRNDGKNNIIPGNCFAQWLNAKQANGSTRVEYLSKDVPNRVSPITKVLMNPPFPKKKTDNKEYRFIDQALKQMQDEGILFSVLPYSCLIKGGGYLSWRKNLIKENTLLSVVTFPEDLFYPVGVHTLGLIVKKGIPHATDQKVLWLRALRDGRSKKKGKRLENSRTPDDYKVILPLLKNFVADQAITVESLPAFQKASPIDFSDEDFELVPEAYLDEPLVTTEDLENDIDQLIRDNIAFQIKFQKQLNELHDEIAG